MDILVYTTSNNLNGNKLSEVISASFPGENINICNNFKSLSKRLHLPRNNLNVAVLTTSDRSELSNILSIKELLADLNVIVVLPNSHRDTIAMGHLLAPRFLTFSENDPDEVTAVLNKMSSHSKL